jgi:hypothetical protein
MEAEADEVVAADPVAIPEGRPAPKVSAPVRFGRWILDQFDAVDAEYRRPPARLDLRAAGAFWLMATMQTLMHYVANKEVFYKYIAGYLEGAPLLGLLQHVYNFTFMTFCYAVVPGLYVKFVLKERLRDFGLTLRGTLRHVPIYLALFLFVMPFVGAASTTSGFLEHYPKYKFIGASWTHLVVYEGFYAMQFFGLEFFFRGFALFYFARYLGIYAVFMMVLPYTLIHHMKPFPEAMGAIITGTVLGTLALRTRSIVGGFFIHVAIAWSMDLLAAAQRGLLAPLFK